MKKLILITLVAVSLFSTSCTKEYVTNVVGGNADMRTVDFNVLTNDWVEYGTPGEQGYGFAVDLDFPEITNNVIQNGMVTLYMKRGNTWTSIPFNYFYRSTNVVPVNYEGGYFYSIQQGVFSIDYYESDHLTHNPGDQTFRLVIVQPI
jgi:hypothetical protein